MNERVLQAMCNQIERHNALTKQAGVSDWWNKVKAGGAQAYNASKDFATNSYTKSKDWVLDPENQKNVGVGAAGGIVGGLSAYGISGLSPSLRDEKRIRLLLALAAAAPSAAASGYYGSEIRSGVGKGYNAAAEGAKKGYNATAAGVKSLFGSKKPEGN